jgi:hypothetical protein
MSLLRKIKTLKNILILMFNYFNMKADLINIS